MDITVKLLATVRRYQPQLAPGESLTLTISADTTVSQVLERLGIPTGAAVFAMVNTRVRKPDHVLSEGDTLSVFPPVAGG